MVATQSIYHENLYNGKLDNNAADIERFVRVTYDAKQRFNINDISKLIDTLKGKSSQIAVTRHFEVNPKKPG